MQHAVYGVFHDSDDAWEAARDVMERPLATDEHVRVFVHDPQHLSPESLEESDGAHGMWLGLVGGASIGAVAGATMAALGFATTVAGGAVGGIVVGALVGGLSGLFDGVGRPDHTYERIAEGLDDGDVLVTVASRRGGRTEAQLMDILRRHGAEVAARRRF